MKIRGFSFQGPLRTYQIAFVISIKYISLINYFDFVFIYMLHVYLHVTGLRLTDNPVY